MKKHLIYRWIPVTAILLCVSFLPGCGDTHTSVQQAAFVQINELLYSLEKVKKADSLGQEMENIQRSYENLQQLKNRKESLPAMSPAQKDRFEQKYLGVMKRMWSKLNRETSRVLGYAKKDQRATIEGSMNIIKQSFIAPSVWKGN